MLLMDWDSGGQRGYVLGDEEGHPTSIACSSGYGSYEAGAEYSVDEVLFSPSTQSEVRNNCGEATFPKLMAVLEKRKLPDGMYYLSEAVKKTLPREFSGDLPDWKIVFEEASAGERLLLLRHDHGAMMWADVHGGVARRHSFVEGPDAHALDVEHSFLFGEPEKKRICDALVAGVDGMKAMRELFGNELASLRLLSEKTDAYNNWTRRDWYVIGRGVLHLTTRADGSVEHCYLWERGEAYIRLGHYPRF
jgi:hypothetical protein